jgi:hypothetical protein
VSGEGRSGRLTVVAVTAVGAALVHQGVLGWDRDVVVDPRTGSASGPIGAALLLPSVLVCSLAVALLVQRLARSR